MYAKEIDWISLRILNKYFRRSQNNIIKIYIFNYY